MTRSSLGRTWHIVAFVVAVIALVLQRTIGFRVDPEHEATGVDLVLHGETAYEFGSVGGGHTTQVPSGATQKTEVNA